MESQEQYRPATITQEIYDTLLTHSILPQIQTELGKIEIGDLASQRLGDHLAGERQRRGGPVSE